MKYPIISWLKRQIANVNVVYIQAENNALD